MGVQSPEKPSGAGPSVLRRAHHRARLLLNA
jgi:hypothetical protein